LFRAALLLASPEDRRLVIPLDYNLAATPGPFEIAVKIEREFGFRSSITSLRHLRRQPSRLTPINFRYSIETIF
jgi:hypothetical protein